MSSKAQLEINETILVLIIFTLLVIIAIVVFHRYNKASIDATVLDNQRLALYDMLNQLPNSPELKCSTQGNEEECIDLLKAFSLSKFQSSYFARYGYRTIKLKLIYPALSDNECSEQLFQSAGFPNCNSLIIYERVLSNYRASEIVSSPIAVYNPLKNEYILGLLEITWYY